MRIKKLQRGFTLVELMIVVAIVGILAALAIYGVRRYVLNAKTAEARTALGRMSNDATSAFNGERMAGALLNHKDTVAPAHRFCYSASATVPTAAGSIQGKKYQSGPQDWGGTGLVGWKCLKFTMDDPQYFMYNYISTTTTGQNAAFTARAQGDLDGDGSLSTFDILGGVIIQDNELMARRAPSITEVNPEE